MKTELVFDREEMLDFTEVLKKKKVEYEVRSYISQSNGFYGERHYEITFTDKVEY